jgi:ATP-binding cassette, subfamily B, bacterial MsbA
MSQAEDLRRLTWLLRTYLAPYWPAVALLVVLHLLSAALAAAFSVLMAPILDLALGVPIGGAPSAPAEGLSLKNLGALLFQWLGIGAVEDRFRAVLVLCVVYVLIGVVKGSVDFGNYMLGLWIRVRAAVALQADLFRHLLSQSLGFFTRQRTGELVSRLSADTHAATSGLEALLGTLFVPPLLIAFYGYLMVRTSPRLVFAAVVAVLLHYGITRAIRGPIRRLATDQFSVLADLSTRFQEAILSVRVVKSFGAEAFEASRLGRTLAEARRINVKFGLYKHGEEPARAVVGYVAEASILLLAVHELIVGRLPVPTFFLFVYVGRAVMIQIAHFTGAYTQLQGVLAAASRIGDLLAMTPAVKDGPDTIDGFRDRIALRDVTFDYGGERVLNGVDLEIGKGEVVALVGPSGSGKSTLTDLILRLYDPIAGRITIDGRDLRSLQQASYRRLFGVVSQEALLLNASIRDNITYGREGLSEADIVRAATIANAHDFVTELPDGYDTMAGDRGIRLSGGQRQRIAIARAIAARPEILVLDEATSSLDSESERLVQQAIERVIQGTTSIVVAHRLSTVLHADRIVVLGRAGIEAVGRHAELLASSETYARLYRLQFAEAEPAVRVGES